MVCANLGLLNWVRVVGLLVVDIIGHNLNLVSTNGIDSITLLPGKRLKKTASNPSTRSSLYLLNQVGRTYGWLHADQEV